MASVEAQIVAPREDAQIALGPLSIYPSLRLVDAGIDENVFNDPENPKEDFTFTVASRVLAVLRLGLNEALFSTGTDYVWFKEFGSERSSNATYAARLNLSASRWKPYIGAERTRTRARVSPKSTPARAGSSAPAIVGSSFNLTERTALTMSAQWVGIRRSTTGSSFAAPDLDDALNDRVTSYSARARGTR